MHFTDLGYKFIRLVIMSSTSINCFFLWWLKEIPIFLAIKSLINYKFNFLWKVEDYQKGIRYDEIQIIKWSFLFFIFRQDCVSKFIVKLMLLLLFSQKRREWVIDLFLSDQANKSEILLLFIHGCQQSDQQIQNILMTKKKLTWPTFDNT